MAYFYGWTHEYILGLPVDVVNSYWLAITQIEAQEILIKMRLADYPQIKQTGRTSWHREMHRLAYPKTHSGQAKTIEDIAKYLGAALNGK